MDVRTSRAVFTLLAALTLAAPAAAAAQEANLAEIIVVEPASGHRSQFEDGVRRHMEALRAQGVEDAWVVWSIMTGEDSGNYLVGTFGHTWSDFDRAPADPAALQRSFEENIEPHVARAEVSFWRRRGDLSRMDEGPPSAFEQVYHYLPTITGGEDVEAVIGRIRAAAEAQGWSGQWGVYQLVNGGEHPHYVVTISGERFADFEDPDPTLMEILVAEYGQEEAGELFARFAGALRAERSEMLRLRRELSYLPE